ncbi:MAG: hypothetical protein J0M12_02235 [Deltaproteobacteria bacterium]|nr:hypothetical protein [Deltaproteobacteria bacterium]
MKRLEDYMESCLASEEVYIFGSETETPEAPPAPTKPAAPPQPEPVRVPPPQPLPGPQREPERVPMPGQPPSPSPYEPPRPQRLPLPLPLRPVCGVSMEVGEFSGSTRLVEYDGDIDSLTMPDLEALVREAE